MPSISELPKNSVAYPTGLDYDNELLGTEMVVVETADGKTARDLLSRVRDWILAAAASLFSAIDHDHDQQYASVEHNHDDVYAPLMHSHPPQLLYYPTKPAELASGVVAFVQDANSFFVGNESNIPIPALGFYEFLALLTQTSTDNPTPIVLKSNLPVAAEFTRTGAGDYLVSLSTSFALDINKMVVDISSPKTTDGVNTYEYKIEKLTASTFRILTTLDGTPTDEIFNVLGDNYLSIKVYI